MKTQIPAAWRDNQDAARKYHGADYEAKSQIYREILRTAMQDGITLEAAVAIEVTLAETGPQPTTSRMLVLAAACDVADAMETPVEERLAVAEAEAPVQGKGKGKKKQGSGGKVASAAGWAGGVAKRGIVVQLKPPEGRELFAWLEQVLDGLKFQAGPGALRSGTTLPDSMLDFDFSLRSRWILKDAMACFGWREDARKVSGGAIKRVTQERMREQGLASKAAEKQIRQGVEDDLMSKAIPSTTHAVCVVHQDGWMLWGGSRKGLDVFTDKIGNGCFEVPTLEKKIGRRISSDGWAQTNLRAPDGVARNSDGSPDRIWTFGQLVNEFMLWLVVPDELGRKVEWTDKDGVSRDATWRPEGNFSLFTHPGGTAKPENLQIKGQDSVALVAALASGASITNMRLKLEESWDVVDASAPQGDGTTAQATLQNSRAYEFSLSRSGLVIGSLKLPKAGYGASGVAWERTMLLRQLDGIVVELFRAYMAERERDWAGFVARARAWLGLELVRRFAFDPATGQGLLFRHAPAPAIEEKSVRRGRK